MAGPYVIGTPVKGQPISASAFGVAVRDAINDLHTRVAVLETGADPLVRLIQTAAQSYTSGTVAALTFGTGSNSIDTNSFHSETTNNSRVTPSVPGYYEVQTDISFATGASSYTQITAAVAKNGTRVDPQDVRRPDPGTPATSAETSALATSNGLTDYFEGWGSQNSSGAQNTNQNGGFRCTLQVKFLRPL